MTNSAQPKRPEAYDRERVPQMIWVYDTDEADAYIEWQTALIRDLLADHQRIEPHHADLCELCKRASAALGQPAT